MRDCAIPAFTWLVSPFQLLTCELRLLMFLVLGIHIFVLISVGFRSFSGNSVHVFPVTRFGYQFKSYRNFFALITDLFEEVKYFRYSPQLR